MSLAGLLESVSGALCLPVPDPLSLGLRVTGLPEGWRQTNADSVDGTPAASWLDSETFDHPNDPALVFASNALLMAWRISGLGRTPIETVGLFSAMTEEIPGWVYRSVENVRLDAKHASVRLFGTLESPYGPLICNAHNIVYAAAVDELIAVQLSVTANPGDGVDQISLTPAAVR